MKIIKIGLENKINIIISHVCEKWGVKIEALKGLGKSKSVARARMETMALIKNKTPLSLTEIGKIFNRHHTTVIYACKIYNNNSKYFNI